MNKIGGNEKNFEAAVASMTRTRVEKAPWSLSWISTYLVGVCGSADRAVLWANF